MYIVTYGDRVILDGGGHRLFKTRTEAIKFILAHFCIQLEYTPFHVKVLTPGGRVLTTYDITEDIDKNLHDFFVANQRTIFISYNLYQTL